MSTGTVGAGVNWRRMRLDTALHIGPEFLAWAMEQEGLKPQEALQAAAVTEELLRRLAGLAFSVPAKVEEVLEQAPAELRLTCAERTRIKLWQQPQTAWDRLAWLPWRVLRAIRAHEAGKRIAVRRCEGCGQVVPGNSQRRYCGGSCRKRLAALRNRGQQP